MIEIILGTNIGFATIALHSFTYAIQAESQWERTSLQRPENVTPIKKTAKSDQNATPVDETLHKVLSTHSAAESC